MNQSTSSALATTTDKCRITSQSPLPSTLTDIYRDDVNLAVWQHSLTDNINRCIEKIIIQKPKFRTVMVLTPSNAYEHIANCLDDIEEIHDFCQHITLLVDMFCTLFELECAGLRLKLLDSPMCPRFHVDKVPCRLVTTLHGPATQWLPQEAVNRNKLGSGSNGLSDDCSGLINPTASIEQISCGDIALLKGENWHNNEQAGLVHRSPICAQSEQRLILTLDFMS
ncbi:DUF1826 domain-containing protein [Colwellia psychrerythraea]|uniref:Succinylglutamate desuccinylase n=1 Tax=Colwellia psychrerythraea TaxID=28229 RepID=A0A099KYN7_COLPS|nr:DUF1826 domain-containing protein [Colwellia psychrerythraea]KGJ95320.1 protein of unknown function DUF1826 [Colwellia psychrerythraea]